MSSSELNPAEQITQALDQCREKHAFVVLRLNNLTDLAIAANRATAVAQIFHETATKLLRSTDTCLALDDANLVLVLDNLIDVQHAQLAAIQLHTAFDEHLECGKLNVDIAVVYLARLTPDQDEVNALFEQARGAARQATLQGNGYASINACAADDGTEDWERDRLMTDALKNHEITVDYQPYLDLSDGRTRLVDALIRWRYQGRVQILSDYLPVLQIQTIHDLTLYYLRAVLRDVVDNDTQLTVVVELPSQIKLNADYLTDFKREINFWGVDPEQVVLKLNQNQLQHLESVAEIGCGIMISHAVASALTAIPNPVSYIAVDASVIDNTLVFADLKARLHATQHIVVYNVEDPTLVTELSAQGIEIGQGFYLGAPIDAEQLAQLA